MWKSLWKLWKTQTVHTGFTHNWWKTSANKSFYYKNRLILGFFEVKRFVFVWKSLWKLWKTSLSNLLDRYFMQGKNVDLLKFFPQKGDFFQKLHIVVDLFVEKPV